MTEEELIIGCASGKREYQKELYERYSAKMMAVCYRYVGDRSIASDLLHDGFITIFSHIKDYENRGSFEGWIRRIFVTTALGYLRQQKKFVDTGADEMAWLGDDDSQTALDMISDRELSDKLSELPEGYRTVLNMYAIEGYSHKEIGKELGIEEASSRSQFLRAKKMLKRLLQG